ncbi:MAG: hypothetical protein IJL76_01535 [Bacilli bacterium]|nr:hypothetical protein [Bacilli bacterium]
MNDNEKILEMVKELNENINSTSLSIPLLNEFEIIETDHPNIIFIAKNPDNFMEQFIKDKELQGDYDSHLNNVIKETIEEMKKNDFLSPEKNLLWYKNINDIKVYVQNNIINNVIIKQMNAYIVDKNNMFYQITVSTPPITLDNKMSVEQDNNLNESLFNMLSEIITNIKEN